jgi:AcrR family transcriptional regulator
MFTKLYWVARPNRELEILAAALSVFAERGYDGARVRHIAERAGVSDAALYAHYESKEAIALELFDTHTGRYSETLLRVATDRTRTVEQRIRAVALQTLDAFAAEPDGFAFVINHRARFGSALPQDFPTPARIVQAVLREGQEARSVRSGPLHVFAALVLGCAIEPIRTALDAPAPAVDLRPETVREAVADAAWNAVASRPG